MPVPASYFEQSNFIWTIRSYKAYFVPFCIAITSICILSPLKNQTTKDLEELLSAFDATETSSMSPA